MHIANNKGNIFFDKKTWGQGTPGRNTWPLGNEKRNKRLDPLWNTERMDLYASENYDAGVFSKLLARATGWMFA